MTTHRSNFLGFRNNFLETEHRFSLVVADDNGQVQQQTMQAETERTFIRSSMKPFQALASLQNITQPIQDEALALIIASHAGTLEQQRWVQSILQKANCTESDLQCGSHLPFDKALAQQLICSGQPATPIHHNCSGKHAGMLLACHCQGWDKTPYREPSHPYQQNLQELLKTLCPQESFDAATDGCGVPVFSMSLATIARLYAILASDSNFSRIAKVMATYPMLIGDDQRVDSLLMSVTQGRLLAKVGADGLLAVSNRTHKLGCAIKLWDGQNILRDKAAIVLLENMGWLTSEESGAIKQIRPNLSLDRLNNQCEIIGTYKVLLSLA